MQTTGIVLHSVDYDELASLVGKRLEVLQPANVKVIEYSGPKEPREFYEKRCNDSLTKDDVGLVSGLIDGYRAWKARTIRENRADYMLKLHSSVMKTRCEPPGDIEMHVFPSCFNPELRGVLYRYCDESPQKFIHIPQIMPKREALVEILHNQSELNVELAGSWMLELTAFLNSNYTPKTRQT
jgi:hypothetical protein